MPQCLVPVSQDKVVASMPKQQDPQDPEVRQLPSEGLSSGAIRQRLNYKVSQLALKQTYCAVHVGKQLVPG